MTGSCLIFKAAGKTNLDWNRQNGAETHPITWALGQRANQSQTAPPAHIFQVICLITPLCNSGQFIACSWSFCVYVFQSMCWKAQIQLILLSSSCVHLSSFLPWLFCTGPEVGKWALVAPDVEEVASALGGHPTQSMSRQRSESVGVGRILALLPLSPGLCLCTTLYSKRDFADVINIINQSTLK